MHDISFIRTNPVEFDNRIKLRGVEPCSEKINKIVGTDKKIKFDKNRKRPKTSEVDRLVCDFNKISGFCNWTPNTTLEDGLNKTIEWFKLNKKDNLDFSYHV